ncbi:MAG: hypothetical protein IJR67_04670 [Acholeplasmatales bacterium]|nr:hypothetical protein [Acholeplasmatales bacterium]
MIKTYQLLIEELSNYKNPKTKIQRMVKNHEIFPIAKGLYETNKNVNPFYLADPIYSPSYISFETALSYYDLIPERVYVIKNATFDKKKKKEYKTNFGVYTYQDIPKSAFSYGVELIYADGYTYKIATKEKALLDQLYSTSPIQNMKEMREYLFENMRINEIVLDTFDKNSVLELSKLYHSRNVTLFKKMLLEDKMYD